MNEVRLNDPNGYTVTVLRNVLDIDEARAHLAGPVAVEDAAKWADFGYDARDYTIRVS